MRVITLVALLGLASAAQFTCPENSAAAGSWSPEYFGDCECVPGYEKNADNDACVSHPTPAPTNAPTPAPTAQMNTPTSSPTPPTASPTEQQTNTDSSQNSWGQDGGTNGNGAQGCVGRGAWVNDANMATWCTANCNHYWPYCPSEMCSCAGRRRLSGTTPQSSDSSPSSPSPSSSAPRRLVGVGKHDKRACIEYKWDKQAWTFDNDCRANKGKAKCQLGYNLRYHWNTKMTHTNKAGNTWETYSYSCYKGMCAGETEFYAEANNHRNQGDTVTVNLKSETDFAMCEMFEQMANEHDQITSEAYLSRMAGSNKAIKKSEAMDSFRAIKAEYQGSSWMSEWVITKMDWALYMKKFQSAAPAAQEITASSSSGKSAAPAIVGAVAGVAMVVGVAVVVTRRADAAKTKENELHIALAETEL